MKVFHRRFPSPGRDRWLFAGAFLVGVTLAAISAWESLGPAFRDAEKGIRHPAGIPASSLKAESQSPVLESPRHLFGIQVTVTGYNSTPAQTDGTPFLTASNTRTRRGVIALSRDLLREYTPGAPFAFGDLVELDGVGVFRVEDTMARRYRHRADIWFSSRTAAIRWGRRRLRLSKVSWKAETEERRIAFQEAIPMFAAALTD